MKDLSNHGCFFVFGNGTEAKVSSILCGVRHVQSVILAGILGIGMGMLLAFIKEYFLKSDKEEQGKMSEAKLLLIKNITYFIPKRFKRV